MIASLRKNKEEKDKISYHWGDAHLLVNIGGRILPRIRVLFWSEFLITVGMATIFLKEALPTEGNWMHWLAGLGSGTLYLLAAYRFISRMFYSEQIFIDGNAITIIERTPFSRKSNTYDWKEVGPLHYAGIATKTDHPLKGGCYDYFGFETQEKLTQSLHQEGNLYFNYGGFAVRFARGVYSWDAEEMVAMIKIFAGAKLRLGPEWARMAQQHEWDQA